MTSPKEPAPARHATRAPIDRPVRLQFDDGEEVVEGRSRNVSIGGMFVRGVEGRERGAQVRFELILDEDTSVRGIAEVVWAQSAAGRGREAGLGLKFRFLEQRDRQQIFRLVSEHIKERLVREGPSASRPSSLFEPASTEENEDRAAAAGVDVPPSSPGRTSSEMPSPQDAPPSSLFAATGDGPGASSTPEPQPAPAGRGDETAPAAGPREPWPTPPLEERRPRAGGARIVLRVVLPLLVAVAAIGAFFVLRPGTGDAPGAPEVPAEARTATDSTEGTRAEPAAKPPEKPPEDSTAAPEEEAEEASRPSEPVATAAAAETAQSAPPASDAPVSAPPAPVPAAPPPPSASPGSTAGFTRLVDVRWRRDGADLIVVLETDGRVDEGRFKYFRIEGDSPREVVRLLGVAETFGESVAPAPDVDVVSRVRFGYHPKPEGNELHVVLDLADPAWKLVELAPRGNRLEGVLRR